MMIRPFIHWTLLVSAASLCACNSPNDILCTTNVVPAIDVFVRDSASGSFSANGATATAVDGAFTDSNGFPQNFTQPELAISLAHERAGTYTVTVSKGGYRDWTASGIRVTRDVCHVRTVTLNARLQH